MITKAMDIDGIPALKWGKPSDHVFLFVHGKDSRKEEARAFAEIADEKGMQTLSFDLPGHGARKGRGEECNLHNALRELNKINAYARARWDRLSLFACSIGAYYSLNAYREQPFEDCLFLSPIVDMNALIDRMFLWFGITQERLAAEKRIETPVSVMLWEEFEFARAHPIDMWTPKTYVLYAAHDQLQSLADQQAFADKFSARLTVAPDSDHPFMAEKDAPIVREWIKSALGAS